MPWRSVHMFCWRFRLFRRDWIACWWISPIDDPYGPGDVFEFWSPAPEYYYFSRLSDPTTW